ncbi:MAG: hypothetical protein ACO263_08370 [Cyclobacteriaceae bacterium]
MKTKSLTLLITIFITLFPALVSIAQPQEPDSEELEQRNGFKSIRLNHPIDSVKGAVLKSELTEKGGFPAKVYSVNGEEYKTIGEVKIERIQVKTYKGLVYEIMVITDKDPNLMKAYSKALGKPSFSLRTNLYSWRSKSVVLYFEPTGKDNLKLTYRSYPVFQKMAEDKGRKVDDIMNDF